VLFIRVYTTGKPECLKEETRMLKKLKKSELLILFSYMVPEHWTYMFYVIIGGFLSSMALNLISLSMRNLVLAATEKDSKQFVWLIVLNALSFFLFMLGALTRRGFTNCVSRMLAKVRKATFVKIGQLPMSYYEKNLSGDLISRVTNDLNTFKPLFSDLIPDMFFFIIFGIVSITTALAMNWWLAVIICILATGFKLLNDYLAKAVKEYSNTAYEKSAVLVQELISILTGNSIIKMFGLEEKNFSSYKEFNQSYTDTSITLAFKKSLQNTCNSLLTSFLNVFSMILGAYLVFNGIISLPTVLVISSLSGNISMMFRWTGQIFSEAVATSAAGMRVHDILEIPEEPVRFDTPIALASKYELEFKDVCFSYESKNVLNNINFGIEKGKTTALVGESGGGKSTIMKLLLGFYPINSGNIWIRHNCIARYTLEELRCKFAYVSQESYLFDGTIEENIRYGSAGAAKEEIIEAAKAAYAHDFIMDLEDGYDTVVGERAVKLSGGQKQRIAIARALIKNAPILLLDEATSALDSESQEMVQKALNHLMKNRTTIVIAHRLSTIENSDEILVISNGEIVERGIHSELFAMRRKYFELYSIQFGNVN
jgi:ATP-binding cassette, subfamily B, bacterial